MPVCEKVAGGRVLLRGIGERVAPGDRVDVSEAMAAYLTEDRGDFRVVGEGGAPAADEESEAASSNGFDTDAWLDQDYTDRADRVRAGDVDEHLDAIAEAETSSTVLDAIGERRAELDTNADEE